MLLKVEHITKKFTTDFWGNQRTMAASDVSFQMEQGESLGFIGESGCGKSTIARIIAGLLAPDAGKIYFEGEEITKSRGKAKKELRRKIQIVFQYPQQAFNPKETLLHAVREPIRNFHLAEDRETEDKMIQDLIAEVGITGDQLERYPHEISGGQAQRLAIARSLILNPKLLIADEVTSMLDVSVQAQILNLLQAEQKKRKLGMIFISHDLEVVRSVCDRVAVMKEGRILEYGETKEVFARPQQDFTKFLLDSYITV